MTEALPLTFTLPAGLHMYAIRSSEISEEAEMAVQYDEVLNAVALWGPLCVPLHARCPDRRWVIISDDLELWKPRFELSQSMPKITLTQSNAQRQDGFNVTIFTQFNRTDADATGNVYDLGTRLDKGCDV